MPPHFTIKREAYSGIEAKFRCEHQERQLRLRRLVDGRPAYYRQCVTCGNAGKAASSMSAKSELRSASIVPPYDPELEPQWFARKHVEYVKTYAEIKPRLSAEYEAYLRSPEWRAKRLPVLQRAAGVCECCEHYVPTDVHHLTYERIGNELNTDLMAVCSFCHKLLHESSAA